LSAGLILWGIHAVAEAMSEETRYDAYEWRGLGEKWLE
jgi:hypothetical protein